MIAGLGSDVVTLARFMGVGDCDRRSLAQAQPVLEAALPRAMELLYAGMRAHNRVSGAFIDDAHMERASAAQLTHWRLLLSADFGDSYVARAKRIGAAHARIGLSHGYYIGGYAVVLAELVRAVSGLDERELCQSVQTALVKCALLDISMVLSAYFDVAAEESVARSQFITNLGDQLRSPLSAIIGYAELLREELPQHFATIDDLQQVIGSAERLRQLLDGLLEMAKVHGGGAPSELEWVDPVAAARAAVELVRDDAALRNVTLNVTTQPGSMGLISTDPDKLGRCMYILLRNAVRFTADGSVEVSVKRSANFTSDCTTFEVRDTGVGISDAQMARLFGQNVGGVRDRGGPGIGLMMVRTLARQLNGELTASSTCGEGSIFSLRVCDP